MWCKSRFLVPPFISRSFHHKQVAGWSMMTLDSISSLLQSLQKRRNKSMSIYSTCPICCTISQKQALDSSHWYGKEMNSPALSGRGFFSFVSACLSLFLSKPSIFWMVFSWLITKRTRIANYQWRENIIFLEGIFYWTATRLLVHVGSILLKNFGTVSYTIKLFVSGTLWESFTRKLILVS